MWRDLYSRSMREGAPISAKTLLLAYFFVSAHVYGQSAPGVNGEEAPRAVPGSSGAFDFSGLDTATRTISHAFPVNRAAEVAIVNSYGALRVHAWDNPIVRIEVEITVGAEDAALAEAFAEAIKIAVDDHQGRLSAETVYPGVEQMRNMGGFRVDYELFVPRDASLSLTNDWGETFVQGVGGQVTLQANFCEVELRDIGGIVRVNARGESTLVAHGLRRGGVFVLRRTHAFFNEISGSLSVDNHLGSVELRRLGEVSDVDIKCESGPIQYHVAAGSHPYITATSLYGTVESELMMDYTAGATMVRALSINVDATQRVTLQSSFASIRIIQDTPEPVAEPLFGGGNAPPVMSEETHTIPAEHINALIIDAIVGDVRVEGADIEEISITAVKKARVPVEKANDALEALQLRVNEAAGGLSIDTAVVADLESMGTYSYRIDLEIQVPRTMLVNIYADDGHTTVTGTGGNTAVRQSKGTITVQHAKGELDLINDLGDIDVHDCAGPVHVRGAYGTATLRNIYGLIDLRFNDGKTILESPHAGVTIRHRGGDVRILALEGIRGEYDVRVEDGNISMAVPPSASASFWLASHNGAIYPRYALTGTFDRDNQTGHIRLNEGTHRVTIETFRGNIILD